MNIQTEYILKLRQNKMCNEALKTVILKDSKRFKKIILYVFILFRCPFLSIFRHRRMQLLDYHPLSKLDRKYIQRVWK